MRKVEMNKLGFLFTEETEGWASKKIPQLNGKINSVYNALFWLFAVALHKYVNLVYW